MQVSHWGIRLLKVIVGLWIFMSPFYAIQAHAFEPLPAEQVFQLLVSAPDKNAIQAEWRITPGYYLYADRIHFTFKPTTQFAVAFPSPETIISPDNKPEKVYSGTIVTPILVKSAPEMVTLTINYQGCAQAGFCYPPMKKIYTIDLAKQVVTLGESIQKSETKFSLSALLTDQNKIQSILATQHVTVLLVIFLALGILLAFTPCVLPMLPILTGIIVGQKKTASTKKAFFLALSYVLGMAIMYAIGGIIAALLGSSIQVWLQKPIIIGLVSLLFILLGLSLFEFYDIPFSRRLQNIIMTWSNRHESGTYVGVFLMGVLSTLVVSPCVTAPLVGVLIYVAQTGSVWLGASALFVMGLGMGIPLVLVGISAGHWLPKSGAWMKIIVKIFGLIMFAMAIWLLSRIFSPNTMLVLWGVFLMSVAAFISFYLPKHLGFRILNCTLAILIASNAIILMLMGVGITAKFDRYLKRSQAIVQTENNFVVVHGITALQQKLDEAKAQGIPALVDFYASWCASCIVMEKEVFSAKRVQPFMKHFMLIQVDLSANSSDDQAIMQQYKVIAPPTVLFFNAAGKEVESRRIVGELSASEFISRLNLFMSANCDKKVEC